MSDSKVKTIKYLFSFSGHHLTRCPYFRKIYVGSLSCRECRYHMEQDYSDKSVRCAKEAADETADD